MENGSVIGTRAKVSLSRDLESRKGYQTLGAMRSQRGT